MLLLLLLSSWSIPSNAELKIADVHKCLKGSDVYFFGNSVSRGTYEALLQILSVQEHDVHWQSNITTFGRRTLHNRKEEKESCPTFKQLSQTINDTTLPHSCDEVYYNNTAQHINLMFVYWQKVFSKSLDHNYNFLLERVRQSGRKNLVLYNAGQSNNKQHQQTVIILLATTVLRSYLSCLNEVHEHTIFILKST
jgi:hypothetical protein